MTPKKESIGKKTSKSKKVKEKIANKADEERKLHLEKKS